MTLVALFLKIFWPFHLLKHACIVKYDKNILFTKDFRLCKILFFKKIHDLSIHWKKNYELIMPPCEWNGGFVLSWKLYFVCAQWMIWQSRARVSCSDSDFKEQDFPSKGQIISKKKNYRQRKNSIKLSKHTKIILDNYEHQTTWNIKNTPTLNLSTIILQSKRLEYFKWMK